MTEGYGHTLTGDIEQHAQFASRILKNQRDIWVYLPPGYRRSTSRRYPVFYLHDGQNVFDAATAFALSAESKPRGKLNTISSFIKQAYVLLLSVCGRLTLSGEISSFHFSPTLPRTTNFSRSCLYALTRNPCFTPPIVAICSYFSRKKCDFTRIYASV